MTGTPDGAPMPAIQPTFRKTIWTAILLLSLVLLLAGALKGVFSPLQEAARLELGMTDFQVGLVQGIASVIPVALLSLPLAWLTDHGNRVRLLTVLAVIWIAGTIGVAFTPNFGVLFSARMLVSLGASGSFPVIVSLAADFCLPRQRGRALLFIGIGAWAGAAAAFALGGGIYGLFENHRLGVIAGLSPWRETHLVFAAAGAVLVLPLLLLREPARHEVEKAGADVGPTLRALWARRGFLIPLFIGNIGFVMADASAGIWGAPVLIRHYRLQPAQFAGWMGAVILFSGILGSLVGGFGADLGQRLKLRGAILLAAVIAAAVGIPAAIYPVMPTTGGFALLLTVMLLGGTITGVVANTALSVIIPNEERGLCLAVFGVAGSVVALGVAPFLVTYGSQLLGGGSHLNEALAVTGVATGLLSLAGFIFAMLNAPPPAAVTTGEAAQA